MLSGGVEADDFLVAARDRTRGRGQARSTDTRPMLAAAGRTSGRRGRISGKLTGGLEDDVLLQGRNGMGFGVVIGIFKFTASLLCCWI